MTTRRRAAPGETSSPLGEDVKSLRARALKILRALERFHPDARVPLEYSNPLELLVATILSAQCTDVRVNEVTPALFAKYRTAQDWADAPLAVLEEEIRPTGFFRNKARAIKESAADMVDRFGGRVPSSLEDLTSLRGIGRKSANVVIAYAFGGQGIIVDTHFTRLARRMGLTAEIDPVKIERDLMAIIPRGRWSRFSLMLTWHGRTTCRARRPACGECPVTGLCPASDTSGVVTWKVKVPASKTRAKRGSGGPARRSGPRKK